MTHDELQDEYQRKAAESMTVNVKLSRPIKAGGAETQSLTFRRPTLGDILRMRERKGTEELQEAWLASHLCGVSPEDFKEVDLADYDLCQSVILGFREGRPTA